MILFTLNIGAENAIVFTLNFSLSSSLWCKSNRLTLSCFKICYLGTLSFFHKLEEEKRVNSYGNICPSPFKVEEKKLCCWEKYQFFSFNLTL